MNTRVLLACGLVAALSAPVSAAAPEVVAFAGGERVSVGSVVGSGTPYGGTCVFASPVEVDVATLGSTVVTSVTDTCEVVVTRLDAGLRRRGVPRGPFTPATEEPSSLTSRRGLDAGVEQGLAVPAPRDPMAYRLGIVQQTVYDALGVWQFEEGFDVAFDRNLRTGSISGAHVWDGWCSANIVTGIGVTNEVRSCYVSMPQRGPSTVEMRGGGVYRHLLITHELARLRLAERFVAVRDTNDDLTDDHTFTCGIKEGTLPPGWSTHCYGDEVETLEEL